MSAASHPPATLLPPSTQPFRSHSFYGAAAAPDTSGNHPSYNGPDSRPHTHHHGGGHHNHHHHQGAFPPPPPPPYDTARGGGAAAASPYGALPSAVYVAPPKIEMQPWARNVWRWLVVNTTGVARVDLRRPTPPLPEQYDGNLLVVRSRQSVAGQRGGGGGFQRGQRGRAAEAVPAYTAPSYYPAVPAAAAAAAVGALAPGQPLLMGARIKITRSFLIGGQPTTSTSTSSSEEVELEGQIPAGQSPPGVEAAGATAAASAAGGVSSRQQRQGRRWRPSPLARSWAEKPLLDFGVGVNLDVDRQQIQPVARLKIKDLVSIKAAPLGLLKISRNIPLGPVSLKVRYELPLAHAAHFWEPPARLMVRLDNAAGSGVHLTPGGVEFDEQVLQFGRAVSLRASASLNFPRQLPLEAGEPPLRLQLHRLSLRSVW